MGTRTGFAARLKAIREAKGLSQKQLADAAGLALGAVTKLEQGHREPAWPTVLKLAAALEVTCDEFAKKGKGKR